MPGQPAVIRGALLGAGATAVAEVVYVVLIRAQGSGSEPTIDLRVPMVMGVVGLLALAPLLATVPRARPFSPFLLGFSAAGLILLGVLAMFSIGLLLLVASIPVILALAAAIGAAGWACGLALAGAGMVAVLVLLVAGFWLTDWPIGCSGTSQGGGSSMLRGGYRYTCDNGRFTISPSK